MLRLCVHNAVAKSTHFLTDVCEISDHQEKHGEIIVLYLFYNEMRKQSVKAAPWDDINFGFTSALK